MKNTSIETPRLILKPTDEEDAAFILQLFNTPKWKEHIGDRKVHTVEEAKQYIAQKMTPQLERLGYSNNTVILKETGEKIGVCGLYDREGLEGVDIGFAFLPYFEKKGFAFEAAQKLIEVGFNSFGIVKILAITTHQNTASQKLIERLGFTFVEVVRIPNDPEELRLYELLKN